MYITNSLLTEFDQELHDRCTYEDGVAEGEARGRASGLAEGAQQNAIANAKSMLNDSVSAEQVAKWTSLPLEQVLALKNEMVHA
jgi:predicted transposase YdaD